MLISKILIYFSDKMLLKRVKTKKLFIGPNLVKSQFLSFFNFDFLEAFFHKGTYIYIFAIKQKILDFLYLILWATKKRAFSNKINFLQICL